ncbi:glutathione S-transferase N-terminal domain-containing protein [Photobacterium toruni]|uniref:Disulfide-bond oxidoreductase YfcG n=1 Tax=Photobacterium toruni TaxID=1935446 RepID=A0A1T4SSU1_9GAMM|nr:glutathione binding-like protein [Photobacterium toruni]SKA31380.1 Disulfide-bond oxidoreductase YfcG [Photobacterium toruni]
MKNMILYTIGSPNGIKIPILLEELKLDYTLINIDITKNEQFSPVFTALNPRHKIPVLIDNECSKGKSHVLAESCSILLYLADKYNKFISDDLNSRTKTIEWLFYQASTEGTVFGAYGHFSTYHKDKVIDPYPKERYLKETVIVLDYIDSELKHKLFLVDDKYSIADIAMFPWIIWIINFYNIDKVIDMSAYSNITNWVARCCARPETMKGLETYHYLDIKNNH